MGAKAEKVTAKQQAIKQLTEYRQKQARIQVLSNYPVGGGITVSRLNEDDHLQELHAKLRPLPSYMYLSEYEQKLESVAHAYMTRYPAGVKSQKWAVPIDATDEEDQELLEKVREKIEKVIAARGYAARKDIDKVLDRLTEYQNLQAEVSWVDTIMNALENYAPDYARLIWLHVIDGLSWLDVTKEMKISKDVFYRLRKEALAEYEKLAK